MRAVKQNWQAGNLWNNFKISSNSLDKKADELWNNFKISPNSLDMKNNQYIHVFNHP